MNYPSPHKTAALGSLMLLTTSVLIGLEGCAAPRPAADTNAPDALPPLPALLLMQDGVTPVDDVSTWETQRRPELHRLFAHYVYGVTPGPVPVTFERRIIDSAAFDGLASLEEIDVVLGEHAEAGMRILLAVPHDRIGPPVFLMQNKCGNQSVLDHPAVPVSKSWVDAAVCTGPNENRNFRGDRYQVEFLLASGFAVATFHESEIDPDRDDTTDGVQAVFTVNAAPDEAWGMLAAWAWGMQRAIDVLVNIPEIDSSRIAVYGHSRRGKAALLAAATDARVRLAVVNQSGTGGATLSRSFAGESVAYINLRFPWWFNDVFPRYNNRELELPVDQHQLIAMVAPRSLLLANADGDTWADPVGSYRAAEAADAVWKLYGSRGLDQEGAAMTDFTAPLAYHLRDGGHSVSLDDWAIFVRYARAQFEP